MSHYDTLDIPKDADADMIKRAYHKKSKEHHPDKGGDTQEMTAVNQAYRTLKDPEKRKRYDATGQDDSTGAKPTREQQAQNVLMSLFAALLQNRITSGCMKFCISALQENRNSVVKNKAALLQQQKFLLDRRDKVKRGGNGRATVQLNAFHMVIDQQLQNLEFQLQAIEHDLLVLQDIEHELQQYTFTNDGQPQVSVQFFVNTYSSI